MEYNTNIDPFDLASSLGFARPVHIGMDLFACVQTITPEIAKRILDEFHIERNRSKSNTTVAKLVTDMGRGRWNLTHQGIAFNDCGLLFDGQHRLHSCIEANKPFTTAVFFNVRDESMRSIDTGRSRSVRDAIAVTGGAVLSNSVLSAVRNCVGSGYPIHVSNETTILLIEAMAEGAEFVSTQFPNHVRKITTGPFLSAVIRAFYFFDDTERLQLFCDLMKSGLFLDKPGHRSAQVLWVYLKDVSSYGGAGILESYLKSSSAIRSFMAGKDTSRLYATKTNEIPLTMEIANRIKEVCPSLIKDSTNVA